MRDLQELRKMAEKYVIESEDLYWKNWVGLQERIEISDLYNRYRELFEKETVIYIRDLFRKQNDPFLRERTRALYGLLTFGYLEFKTRDLQEEILEKEAVLSVTWKGEKIPLRSVEPRILKEQKREDKIALKKIESDLIEKELKPLRQKQIQDFFKVIEELGYNNYSELNEETQDREFGNFAEDLKKFLDKSHDIFMENLEIFLKSEVGITFKDKPHFIDYLSLIRSRKFDYAFPQEKMVNILKATLSGLGFTLDGITLDIENRPKKKQRPCVSAVNPPDDVRLCTCQNGGYDDYSNLFHETGHTVHFKHMKRDLDFEFKFWGDRGLTEGTAYLLQHVTINPEWLKKMMSMENSKEFLKYRSFMDLLMMRRQIVRLLFQLDLFTDKKVKDTERMYLDYMEKAHGVRFEVGDHLSFDLEYYSAGYARARVFEAQLRKWLENAYGMNWWEKKEIKDFLVPIYRQGRRFRAENVLRDIKYSKLDPDFFYELQLAQLINN